MYMLCLRNRMLRGEMNERMELVRRMASEYEEFRYACMRLLAIFNCDEYRAWFTHVCKEKYSCERVEYGRCDLMLVLQIMLIKRKFEWAETKAMEKWGDALDFEKISFQKCMRSF